MSKSKYRTSAVAAAVLLSWLACAESFAQEREHPLVPALELARATHQYVLRHVGDFSCILVKRERVDGVLMRHQYLLMKVRHERVSNRGIVTPYSVYVRYLAPKRLKGREVLYVAGWNDGKMRVRKGGGRFSYVKVNVDPMSDAALREARYPITDIGIATVIERLIEQIEDDVAADPEGANTQVQFFENAKVGGRLCTHIRVRHPEPGPGLDFYSADVYVDDELHVPIRVEGRLWPESEGEPPQLVEEYTFTRLRLNVGLTDVDFSPSRFQ